MASLDKPSTTWIIFMLLTPKLSSTANFNSLRIFLVQSQNFRSVFNSRGSGFDFHAFIWLWWWSWVSACWLYCFSCLRWLGATLVVVVVGNSFGNSCDDFSPSDCLGDSGGGVWWLWWWWWWWWWLCSVRGNPRVSRHHLSYTLQLTKSLSSSSLLSSSFSSSSLYLSLAHMMCYHCNGPHCKWALKALA